MIRTGCSNSAKLRCLYSTDGKLLLDLDKSKQEKVVSLHIHRVWMFSMGRRKSADERVVNLNQPMQNFWKCIESSAKQNTKFIASSDCQLYNKAIFTNFFQYFCFSDAHSRAQGWKWKELGQCIGSSMHVRSLPCMLSTSSEGFRKKWAERRLEHTPNLVLIGRILLNVVHSVAYVYLRETLLNCKTWWTRVYLVR